MSLRVLLREVSWLQEITAAEIQSGEASAWTSRFREKIFGRAPASLSKTIEEIEDICIGMGYEIAEGPEVKQTIIFRAIESAQGASRSEMQDSFYLDVSISSGPTLRPCRPGSCRKRAGSRLRLSAQAKFTAATMTTPRIRINSCKLKVCNRQGHYDGGFEGTLALLMRECSGTSWKSVSGLHSSLSRNRAWKSTLPASNAEAKAALMQRHGLARSPRSGHGPSECPENVGI